MNRRVRERELDAAYRESLLALHAGKHGRIIGTHAKTGNTGEVVDVVKCPAGWALVVKCDGTGEMATLPFGPWPFCWEEQP